MSRLHAGRAVRGPVVLAALLATASGAQTMMDTSTLDLGIMQTQQRIFLGQSLSISNGASGSSGSGTRRRVQSLPLPPPDKLTAGTTVTSFRPVAPSLAPRELAAELSSDAKRRARLEEYFGRALADYRTMLRQKGSQPNDVARAVSFVVATCYDILHGEQSFDEVGMNALRAQMAYALPQAPGFRAADDRRKQLAFERFAILGIHLGDVRERADQTHDPKLRQLVRQMAGDQLRSMFGVPAERIRIDRRGISF